MSNRDSIPHWYALRTKSRHEKFVRDRLANLGIEQLLPTIRRLNQWKDRKKEIETPLFSGYCFVRMTLEEKTPILRVSGVVGIVGRGKCPEPIPEEQMTWVRVLMDTTLHYDSYPYIHEGMQVEVKRGPLAGVQGVLLRKGKHHRLLIGVHLIQQAAAVEIDVADVTPISRGLFFGQKKFDEGVS